MFDQCNVTSLKLSFGVKVLAGSLICGRFTSAQSESVAAIAHTLDKVVILDTDAAATRTEQENVGADEEASIRRGEEDERAADEGDLAAIVYVAIRDVIKSIGAVPTALSSRSPNGRDLLLVGCPCSVILYNVHEQTHLLSIRTSGPIECIYLIRPSVAPLKPSPLVAICAGAQKLYTIRLAVAAGQNDHDQDSELTSERSTSGHSISCMTTVELNSGLKFLLAGSSNETGHGGTISLYELAAAASASSSSSADLMDNHDNSIRACRLRIDESAPISCLCAIPTVSLASAPAAARSDGQEAADSLPSLQRGPSEASERPKSAERQLRGHYFAYGLENGLLGVHRLVERSSAGDQKSVGHERLWRLKCKCAPTSLSLFDLNGDGHQELVVAFAGGRLELRAPFTGQLLAATRLAGAGANNPQPAPQQQAATNRAQQSGLALAQLKLTGGLWLLGCSGRGTIIGFRPLAPKPPQPLQDVWAGGAKGSSGRSASAAAAEIWHHQLDDETDLSAGASREQLDLANKRTAADLHALANDSSVSSWSSLSGPEQEGGGGGISSASSCVEARQSYDLLQKINSLYAHRIDLRQRVSRALVVSAGQASAAAASYLAGATCLREATAAAAAQLGHSQPAAGDGGLSVRHRWDLDLAKLELQLTIVAGPAAAAASSRLIGGGSQIKERAFKLVQVEEEKRILIESGCRLLANELAAAKEVSSDLLLRDATFVSRLQFGADHFGSGQQFEPTSLKLKLFQRRQSSLAAKSSSLAAAADDDDDDEADDETQTQRATNFHRGRGNILQKLIDVPTLALFTFAPVAIAQAAAKSSPTNNLIRLSYRLDDRSKLEQVFHWLEENLLCLQRAPPSPFGSAADDEDQEQAAGEDARQQQRAGEISDAESYAKERSRFIAGHSTRFKLELVDAKQTLVARGRRKQSDRQQVDQSQCSWSQEESFCLLRVGLHRSPTDGGGVGASSSPDRRPELELRLECENGNLAAHLVQSLVIDRLRLDPVGSSSAPAGAASSSSAVGSLKKLAAALSSSSVDNLVACCRLQLDERLEQEPAVSLRPLLEELLDAHRRLAEQEESESRILTELYESADYVKSLMQQLSIAIELNEFSTARELLGESFMMLDGTQTAARGHSLNSRSRRQLSKSFHQIRDKLSLITTGRLASN